ncbi:MAG: hypothetical protein EBU57_14620, partial [Alphaproteobacteria bacterium]|nr:hypothetical protein [Alphaproteobacteria bacterium]
AVTDADLIMGKLDPDNFAGGSIQLETGKSAAALNAHIGQILDMDATEAAWGLAEVVDENTGEPVAEGENGILVMTPYWNNEMTPFLRWETGDYVSFIDRGETEGPLSVYPMIRHAARTSGFFKVRGVNINHADFEDFMNRKLDISDFKVEIAETETLDSMTISVELARNADAGAAIDDLKRHVRRVFEVSADVLEIQPGTLEKEFQAQVKQQRFIDKRG